MGRLGFLLALVATGGSLPGLSHGALDRADVCQASKLLQAAHSAGAQFSCHSTAAAQGTAVDPACESLAERRLSDSFAKDEGQRECATRGDAAAVQKAVHDVIDHLSYSVRPDPGPSVCSATKLSAAGEYLSGMLDLYAKQRIRRNDGRLSQRDLYPAMKLRRAFEEPGQGCHTTHDFDAVLARLQNLVGDLIETLWPLSAVGVSFDRPDGWHLHPFFLAAGGDVELNNFSNAYIHGGIIPPGGAVIYVRQDDTPMPSLRTLAKADARQEGATIDSTLEILVSGDSALEVVKHAPFHDGVDLNMVDIYVLHRPVRYRLGLRYWSGDPADHFKTFEAFWRSVRFAEPP